MFYQCVPMLTRKETLWAHIIANLNSSRLWHLVDATTVDTHDLPYAWGDYPMLGVTTQKVENQDFFSEKIFLCQLWAWLRQHKEVRSSYWWAVPIFVFWLDIEGYVNKADVLKRCFRQSEQETCLSDVCSKNVLDQNILNHRIVCPVPIVIGMLSIVAHKSDCSPDWVHDYIVYCNIPYVASAAHCGFESHTPSGTSNNHVINLRTRLNVFTGNHSNNFGRIHQKYILYQQRKPLIVTFIACNIPNWYTKGKQDPYFSSFTISIALEEWFAQLQKRVLIYQSSHHIIQVQL